MAVPKLPTPQLHIFLDDSGTIRAEAIGPNGTRRKIDLGLDFAKRAYEIAADLSQQADDNRAKRDAALRAQQNEQIAYVVQHHGLGLAKRVWNDPNLIFNQSLRRALSDTNLGSGARKSKPKEPEGKVINLDDVPI